MRLQCPFRCGSVLPRVTQIVRPLRESVGWSNCSPGTKNTPGRVPIERRIVATGTALPPEAEKVCRDVATNVEKIATLYASILRDINPRRGFLILVEACHLVTPPHQHQVRSFEPAEKAD